MPQKDLHRLLDRIHRRLDESMVGIAEQLTDLAAADLAELRNQLTLAEAATVISLLPVPRAVEICDQPTMRRRVGDLYLVNHGRLTESDCRGTFWRGSGGALSAFDHDAG